MNNQPLVSIIIPTYNRAHLIGETLDSIIAQTYQNWECIVVDDGSTDDTDAVMNTYCQKDSRIQYHHRPKEHLRGGNGARNYGFRLSTGNYIQWFDSDDIMLEKKIENQVELAEKYQVDLIVCNFRAFNKAPQKLIFDDVLKFHVGGGTINTPMCFFKKKVLSNFKFDETLYKCQEFEFFTRFFYENRGNFSFRIINEPLALVRIQSGSITGGYLNGERKYIESSLRCKLYAYKCTSRYPKEVREIALSKFKISIWKAFLFKHSALYWKYIKLYFKYGHDVTLFQKLKCIVMPNIYFITNRGSIFFKKRFLQ